MPQTTVSVEKSREVAHTMGDLTASAIHHIADALELVNESVATRWRMNEVRQLADAIVKLDAAEPPQDEDRAKAAEPVSRCGACDGTCAHGSDCHTPKGKSKEERLHIVIRNGAELHLTEAEFDTLIDEVSREAKARSEALRTEGFERPALARKREVRTAVMALQEALGVGVDDIVGLQTMEEIEGISACHGGRSRLIDGLRYIKVDVLKTVTREDGNGKEGVVRLEVARDDRIGIGSYVTTGPDKMAVVKVRGRDARTCTIEVRRL